jgi:hypothetical protein
MSNYLREDFTAAKSITASDLKTKIKNYLSNKIDTPIESMEIQEALSEDVIERISTWQDPSLFFVVNNLYVNPTKV